MTDQQIFLEKIFTETRDVDCIIALEILLTECTCQTINRLANEQQPGQSFYGFGVGPITRSRARFENDRLVIDNALATVGNKFKSDDTFKIDTISIELTSIKGIVDSRNPTVWAGVF